MNKKILISISVIGVVAAIAIGGTIAYFSDTETSTGNTFTAGSLDLIVDIDGVVHNPLNGPIFNYTDMKPGDSGEKTISLTVDNNPACGFVSITKVTDLDVSCTGPELKDEPGCTPTGDGQLDENTQFIIWSDMGTPTTSQACAALQVHPGDNKYNPECGDEILTQGTLDGTKNWSIGELNTTTKYFGISWCFGTWNGMTCNGASVNNASQSDTFTGDMVFTAQQEKNQYPSGCPTPGVGSPL